MKALHGMVVLHRWPVLFLLLLATVGCDQQEAQQIPGEAGDTTGVNQSTPELKKEPWPFLGKAENSNSAANLLAANFYVVFDGSGSMNSNSCGGGFAKIDAAKKAMAAFVQAMPADANVGLVVFDSSGTKERASLDQKNRDQVQQEVVQVIAGGGTPLSTAIDIAYDRLTAKARDQLAYGDYHLVVITDGQASSGYDPSPVLEKILKESPVIVQTIGFCIDDDHALNQQGRTIYKTAQDFESLKQGLESVLAEAPDFAVAEFADTRP